MINLSDIQPLSIAKIKKFWSTTGFLLKILSDKVHAILIEEVTVQTTLRDGASFRRLSSIIGHFTIVNLVTWPWMQARLEVTLFW